jgi:L-fuconolactonase
MPIIDAHHHFWKRGLFDYSWLDEPALATINRDYLPADLAPLIRAAGVDRTVFVQTQHNLDETRWALGLADQHECIAGVVGWVDLASLDCERQLLEFKDHPKFKGVRHITQDEPDVDFIVRDDVIRGLRVLERYGVPFDLLVYLRQLKHAATLARMLPDLPLVLDHLGKPRIKDHSIDDWLLEFRAAAAFPNVVCKLSGMITEADWSAWTADDLKPYVQTALELFGPDRLMFGSDWPVCELAGSYSGVKDALSDALGAISESERAAVFGGTAVRFYGLNA